MRGEERREGWCRGGGGGGASPLQVARPSVCVPVRPPKQEEGGSEAEEGARAHGEEDGESVGEAPPLGGGAGRPEVEKKKYRLATRRLFRVVRARPRPSPPPTPHLNPPLFMSSIDWATPAGAGVNKDNILSW